MSHITALSSTKQTSPIDSLKPPSSAWEKTRDKIKAWAPSCTLGIVGVGAILGTVVALGALSAFAPWLPVALAVAFIALVVIGKYAPRSITHKPNPKINMDNFQKLAGRFLYLSECVDILNYLNTHKDELTAQAKNENRCIRVKAHGNPDLRRTLLFTPDGKVFIILNKINKGDKVIGKGAAKVVKYCFELTEQKMCTHATFKDKTMFDKEIILLEKLKGKPNILPLLATDEFMSKDGNLKYSMITEYCDCGDLLSVLEEPDNLPIEQPRDFCRQLAQALKAVHNEGYSHNDIKIENIFVKKEENGAMTPFLADFGLAYEISSDNQKKIDGTWLYLHPHTIRALLDPHAKEILSSQTSRDIWALGAVIYSVAFPNKVVPWMENIPKNVRFGSEEEKRIIFANLEKLSISKKPAFDKPTDETSLEYLAWNMLQADPSKQFNIDQVVNFLTD